ncbi:MAG: site-specific DNA-methyltransferase [Pseudomonadota bacterium]
MPKINLTPEDKAKLIEAMNKGTEPTPDLLPKLFPGTAEKFDVKALDRAKIPTLEYAGKRSKAAILAEAGAGIGAAPLQIVRCFGEAKNGEWKNLIVQGDNLQFLKTCYMNHDPLIKDKVKGKVKLIYIDSPFATESDFADKEGVKSYTDKIKSAEFIESLRERILFLKELLTNDGSIYVHLDMKMHHYIKIVLDEIFGDSNFVNEIVWKRTFSHGDVGQGAKHFGRLHDMILFYSNDLTPKINIVYTPYSEKYVSDFYKYFDSDGRKYRLVSLLGPGGASKGNPYFEFMGVSRYWVHSKETMNRLLKEGKIIQSKPGAVPQKRRYIDESPGVPLQDIWTDVAPIQGGSLEKADYPTQKPEKLLDRIIRTSSKEGDLVMDIFGGSGTTIAVAEKLGRRWITCDFGKHAIYTMQRRMLRIGESKALIEEKDNTGKVIIKKSDPYKKKSKPFCVVSSGAYDFSHIMDLRKHKETYVDFVLGLFQLARDDEKSAKYKLTNIFAVKDNNPVEIYPIWDDEFLKEVKIDETYLRGIITQSGGKLKGDYYIITPESCTNVGDTTLKNQDGKDIHFQMLTFPYKVLEDVSRNLELQEQPSSQANVNTLITSTAYYFNEDVEIDAKRTSDGIKITRFETKILNKEGQRFEGFSGLAMLLVDLDYEAGKPFDMDKTVFAKEIAEDGSMKIEGLTKRVGLIAIDKHGNESKPFDLE